jgi:hypothetical protein
MTTISGTTSALSSLVSLYSSESGASATADSTATGTTDSGLTSDQVSNLVSIVEGGSAGAMSGPDALLGQSTTSSSDLSSIIDAIEAGKSDGSSSASATGASPTSTMTSTATADQQKAAAVMQSVYQTQQANLFTLLG